MIYVDTNLKEENRNIKHQRSDIVIKVNDNTICNLEMNKDYYESYLVKNISYLFTLHNQDNMSGIKYSVGDVYVQINFDNFGKFGHKLINEYRLKEISSGEDYPIDRIKIYHIKLDYLQNKEYTKSENIKFIKYLKLMSAKNYGEALEIVKGGDKIMHEVFNEMMRYAKKLPFGYRDVEYEEMLLRNTFKDEAKKEDAKAMLRKGYPVEDIKDITGLPKKEIEKLKEIEKE